MATDEVSKSDEFNVEQTYYYADAALWAYKESFGLEGEDQARAQWLVTVALEKAVEMLKTETYGKKTP